MEIACPTCRVRVAAEDLARDAGVATCRSCNTTFRFGETTAPAAPSSPDTRVERGPRGVVASATNEALTLKYRWFEPSYLFFAVFCLVWDAALVSWYTAVLPYGELGPLLYPFPLVAVGVAATYSALAGFVNSTTLRIDGDRLRVSHHPLPWSRAVELESGDVQQLFCDRTSSRGWDSPAWAYNLNAMLRDGSRLKVVSGLDSAALPVFLEDHAEAWMGIRDEAVAGELQP
jgi:hypothetical protein